jgi:hypothetical protein
MNYYEPKQREDDGKWDFACYNDSQNRTWPVGRCARHAPEERHDTPQEACECYRGYLLDEVLILEAGSTTSKHKCVYPGCEEYTDKVAKAGPYIRYILCDEHRTKAVVAEMTADLGSFFGSY